MRIEQEISHWLLEEGKRYMPVRPALEWGGVVDYIALKGRISSADLQRFVLFVKVV